MLANVMACMQSNGMDTLHVIQVVDPACDPREWIRCMRSSVMDAVHAIHVMDPMAAIEIVDTVHAIHMWWIQGR